MNKKSLEQQVKHHANLLLIEKGFISPIDLLVKMDRLTEKQVKDWRMKKVPYLEQVVSGNLGKLNHTLTTLKSFANQQNLKASRTHYKSWGKGSKQTLRFSKSGNSHIEELYSTHYISIGGKKHEN